ncbi:hypothetical protein WMF31_34675 [Sorangium sp. So ce1036]|uniref:hypothetical protein n=1 Tax=Sorangium sp. So ce1036 TaxID=3133328 RepID=UPI003F00F185
MLGVPADAERLAAMLATTPDVMMDVPAARYSGSDRVSVRDRVWVPTDALWWNLFDRFRRQLLRSIALRRLVVESCPSSNCVVANLREPPIIALLKQTGLARRDRDR